MQSQLNPYLGFKDNAREAMEFYKSIFGGKLELHTFDENGAVGDAADGKKIMHAMLEAENGITFMASDTPTGMSYTPGTAISMSISGDEKDELTDYFNKLSEGGKIVMPLEAAPWGDIFGMVTDKFGVQWMVNIAGKPA